MQPNTIPLPPEIARRCNEIDSYASKLLLLAKNNGLVLIITNAAEGWVELSAVRFLPKTYELLKTGIEIISARSKFEGQFPR